MRKPVPQSRYFGLAQGKLFAYRLTRKNSGPEQLTIQNFVDSTFAHATSQGLWKNLQKLTLNVSCRTDDNFAGAHSKEVPLTAHQATSETILYFGCYNPLAFARTLILQRQGFNVICSVDPEDAPQLCIDHKIDLIAVCNSCDDQLVETLASALERNSLSTPILRLDNAHSNAWRDPELLALLIRGKLRQLTTPDLPVKRAVTKEDVSTQQRHRA